MALFHKLTKTYIKLINQIKPFEKYIVYDLCICKTLVCFGASNTIKYFRLPGVYVNVYQSGGPERALGQATSRTQRKLDTSCWYILNLVWKFWFWIVIFSSINCFFKGSLPFLILHVSFGQWMECFRGGKNEVNQYIKLNSTDKKQRVDFGFEPVAFHIAKSRGANGYRKL